jgi:hypothetical protein
VEVNGEESTIANARRIFDRAYRGPRALREIGP